MLDAGWWGDRICSITSQNRLPYGYGLVTDNVTPTVWRMLAVKLDYVGASEPLCLAMQENLASS